MAPSLSGTKCRTLIAIARRDVVEISTWRAKMNATSASSAPWAALLQMIAYRVSTEAYPADLKSEHVARLESMAADLLMCSGDNATGKGV